MYSRFEMQRKKKKKKKKIAKANASSNNFRHVYHNAIIFWPVTKSLFTTRARRWVSKFEFAPLVAWSILNWESWIEIPFMLKLLSRTQRPLLGTFVIPATVQRLRFEPLRCVKTVGFQISTSISNLDILANVIISVLISNLELFQVFSR